MGSSFGDRLKQERLERTLTQGEVGADEYPASYIALLESGAREPSVEVIRSLAQRLQHSPHTVHPWVHDTAPSEADYLSASLNAWRCWDGRDFPGTAHHAGLAAGKAGPGRNPLLWWNMSYLQANALLREQDFGHALGILTGLLNHPLTQDDEVLLRRTRQLMAAALLGLGRIDEAIEDASLAVSMGPGTTLEDHGAYLMALQTLIGTLTESGRLEEAWQHCTVLGDSLSEETPAHMAAEMHWVIGNVAFFRHDTTAGLKHHALAGAMFSPERDLARWGQFSKATAWARLTAGVVDAGTLEAIQHSELAHSVVGAPEAEKLELALLRARWLFLSGEVRAALELLRSVMARSELLGSHLAGDAALLFGQALAEQQEPVAARAAFTEATELFSSAGALERLAQAREQLRRLDDA